MQASKKGNKINIKSPVYALLTSDTLDGVAYGEVKSLGKAMQVQITPTIASGNLYGDGKKTEDISQLVGIAFVIDLNKLNIETKAEILGYEYTDGVLIERAGDEPPEIAVGFVTEQTGGTYEQTWLLKGRAQPPNTTTQQRTESINFSTDSITINFIPREYDGQLRFYADTANPEYTAAQATKFFISPETYPAKEG